MSEITRAEDTDDNGYKFLPEIWDIIKDYMGVSGGINLRLPKILLKTSITRLDRLIYMMFREDDIKFIGINATEKREHMMKYFYNNLSKLRKERRQYFSNQIIDMTDAMKFKVPLDLEIDEVILAYKYSFYEQERKVGKVIRITACGFEICIEHENKPYEYIKIRTNRYKRLKDATTINMMQLFNI